MFLAVMWQGIWQVLCAIGRVFNYKNKTPFWRVIWAVLTVCTVLFVGMFSYYFVEDNLRRRPTSSYNSRYLSSHILYHSATSYRFGYVYDNRTNKKLIKDIKWLILSPEDSLAVFCQNNMRGYMNVNTGKVVIPAQYSRAWIFSDGVAAVMENDSIYFINHEGKRIINKGFEQSRNEDDYVFKNECCKVKLNGKFGAIDKNGKIRVPIEYEDVYREEANFWSVYKNGRWGVVNDSAKLIFPCEYRITSVKEDNGIFLTDSANYCRRYSLTGELLDNFVVKNVSELTYDSQVVDEDGTVVYKTARCLEYEVPGSMYGLMTKGGHPLTAPKFINIVAIGEDLYLGHYESEYSGNEEGVLMNSKGEILRR
jgi:hypothetical protein